MIEILTIGALATVQDLGRTGFASLGVPRSGAFDRAAAAQANRLVGNAPGAAVLEVTLGGLGLRVDGAATLAVTGARCSGRYEHGTAITLPGAASLVLGRPVHGLRTYVAVRGGIAAEPVLGSRSTDTLSGLGPRPLTLGDRLPVGDDVAGPVSDALVAPRGPVTVLRVVLGPRADWFVDEAPARLVGTSWTVRPDSDRIGLRLHGPALSRRRGGELPSEPVLPGALQIPPDGRPILFGPDAPTTGGYPVLAVVRDAELDLAAQLRPGDEVRFSRS